MPFAIITGASKGIGREAAHYFADKGYSLALIARNEERLRQLAAELAEKYAVDATYYTLDVRDYDSVDQCIKTISNTAASIDVLFNNAGVLLKGTSAVDPADFKEMLEVNLHGVFNFVHTVAARMKAQRSGYIFNLASYAGKRPLAGAGAYCMTKYGVLGYSQSLSLELAPYDIKVTAICPSVVDTDMTRHIADFPDEDKIRCQDIVHTLDYLLNLSPQAYVDEITIKSTHLLKSAQ